VPIENLGSRIEATIYTSIFIMPEGKQLRFLLLVIAGAVGAYFIYAHSGTVLFFLIPALGMLALTYNKMQAKAHEIREAHSNITICMKKRVDLTNKLIDIASGYGDMEKLTHITVAQTESVQSAITASQEVDGAVNRIISMARAYPDLKANITYQNLMNQLESLENDLQKKREAYNGRVRSYNTACTSVPTVFVAPYLGFKNAPYFDVENADSLESIKDFHSTDGEALRNILSNVSNKITNVSTSPHSVQEVEQKLLKNNDD
jgi:LemA protein